MTRQETKDTAQFKDIAAHGAAAGFKVLVYRPASGKGRLSLDAFIKRTADLINGFNPYGSINLYTYQDPTGKHDAFRCDRYVKHDESCDADEAQIAKECPEYLQAYKDARKKADDFFDYLKNYDWYSYPEYTF